MGFYGPECTTLWVQTDDELVSSIRRLRTREDIEWLSVMFPNHAYSHSPLEFTGSSFSALAELPKLRGLEVRTNCEDVGLEMIALHAPRLRELQFFDQRRMTGSGFRALGIMDELESIGLAHVPVGDTMLKTVAGLPRLKEFQALFATNATREGFLRLAESTELEVFDTFSGAVLSDDDFKLFRRMRKLKKLHLVGQHKLTPSCLRVLEELPLLKEVHIPATRISPSDIAAFWRRHAARRYA